MGGEVMLRLRPYKACDAIEITKWLKDRYAFCQWSADRYSTYPIAAEDMNAFYEADKENDSMWGMTAFDESGVVGHLTMRFPDSDKKTVRFGFVIVDDMKRGKGYGKEMLELAIRYAFDILKAEKISLGVFENNAPAIYTYQSVGFHEIPSEYAECYECMGEVWKCIEMVILYQ